MIQLQRNLLRNFRQLRSFCNSPALTAKKDDKKSAEDGSRPEGQKLSKEEATDKLNKLLGLMLDKDNEKPKIDVQLAQAKKKKKKKPEVEKPFGEKLAGAAKQVAERMGGDVEKTESELLNLLLRRPASGDQDLNNVLSGIKVEQSQGTRADQVRESLKLRSADPLVVRGRTGMRKPKPATAVSVDILGAEPSSYFKDFKPQPAPCELRVWRSCVERDLRLAVTHPPSNIYEQMIQWTDRGMLWKFPIDNEIGLEEEKKVSFAEHVFLENHLEGWCPEAGPLRHFMELVCVGLSKNHWLTAQEKKNHIMWFRDYFADKKELIQEIGLGTIKVEKTEELESSQ